MEETNELAQNFLPIFTKEVALQRYQDVKDFVDSVLKEGLTTARTPVPTAPRS